MPSCLCITIRFLQPRVHGRGEDGKSEWPPSPLRLLQAIVAACAGRWNERELLVHAVPSLRWLESLPTPQIVGASANLCERPYRLYVPDNVADKVATSWSRGRDASIADYRTEKDVRAARLIGDAVHYLYALPKPDADQPTHIEIISSAARAITHLGWGIDMVMGNAAVVTPEQAAELSGNRWMPSSGGGTLLRTPRTGTLNDLMRKHSDFLGRITSNGFRPVPPLRVFDMVRYRRQDQALGRPYRVLELCNSDGSRFRYPHRRLVHIAGMVRHLAIEAMKSAPPHGVGADWVETYVAGHCRSTPPEVREKNTCSDRAMADSDAQALAAGDGHRQLSYMPLPSVGHEHADPGVRRVMIIAPPGDDDLLHHVVRRLAGKMLVPVRGDEFAGLEPPVLEPVEHDNVASFYVNPATTWHSFTPVILPGHDDHKPDKTRKLIDKTLAQSGIAQPCSYEWSAFSRFVQAYSAHKYDRSKRPQGYIRPEHLLSQTAVHLSICFKDDLAVPGPITIGAGRHCGFGLMGNAAALGTSQSEKSGPAAAAGSV